MRHLPPTLQRRHLKSLNNADLDMRSLIDCYESSTSQKQLAMATKSVRH